MRWSQRAQRLGRQWLDVEQESLLWEVGERGPLPCVSPTLLTSSA